MPLVADRESPHLLELPKEIEARALNAETIPDQYGRARHSGTILGVGYRHRGGQRRRLPPRSNLGRRIGCLSRCGVCDSLLQQRSHLGQGHRPPQIAHGPARDKGADGLFGTNIGQQKLPLFEPIHDVVRIAAVRQPRHSQALERALAVAVGDQAADHLDPGVAEHLVIKIARVLGRHPGTDAVRPTLFEEGQQRPLGRRILGVGRDDPLHLVHVEQRTQTGGGRLPAHPGHQLRGQQGDDEETLPLVEMGDRDDGRARRVRVTQELIHVQRHALGPGRKGRAREEGVERHHQLHPLGARVEALQRQRTERFHRWIDQAGQQTREIQRLAQPPVLEDHRGREHVVAVGQRISPTPHQRQQSRGHAVDPVGGGIEIAVAIPALRRPQRRQNVERRGRARTGRQQLPRHTVAHRAEVVGTETRSFESLAPELGLVRGNLRSITVLDRVRGQPRREVLTRERGKIEEQIHHVTLEVDHQERYPAAGKLL